MAGSLGLGIGYEEHHTQTVGVLMNGWQAHTCDPGVWDPDCGCCCQIFPPNTNGYPADPDWTLIWGIDANGNIFPEDDLFLSSDGFWELSSGGGNYHITPVSVTYCQTLSGALPSHGAGCCSQP